MPEHNGVRRREHTVSRRIRGQSASHGEVDGGEKDVPQTTVTDGANGEAAPKVITGNGGESQVGANSNGRSGGTGASVIRDGAGGRAGVKPIPGRPLRIEESQLPVRGFVLLNEHYVSVEMRKRRMHNGPGSHVSRGDAN